MMPFANHHSRGIFDGYTQYQDNTPVIKNEYHSGCMTLKSLNQSNWQHNIWENMLGTSLSQSIFACLYCLVLVISYSYLVLYPSRLNILWSVPAKSQCFILATRMGYEPMQAKPNGLAIHGIPQQLTTDNGSPYFSDEMA